MLTTIQVRNILSRHVGRSVWNPWWTNKTRKNPGNLRTVKVYLDGNQQRVIDALVRAGVEREHINSTPGSPYRDRPGLTVKCILA